MREQRTLTLLRGFRVSLNCLKRAVRNAVKPQKSLKLKVTSNLLARSQGFLPTALNTGPIKVVSIRYLTRSDAWLKVIGCMPVNLLPMAISIHTIF